MSASLARDAPLRPRNTWPTNRRGGYEWLPAWGWYSQLPKPVPTMATSHLNEVNHFHLWAWQCCNSTVVQGLGDKLSSLPWLAAYMAAAHGETLCSWPRRCTQSRLQEPGLQKSLFLVGLEKNEGWIKRFCGAGLLPCLLTAKSRHQ